MNYGDAELEIVDKLNAHFVAKNTTEFYEAVPIPETEADFKSFYANFTKSRAAVQFIDSIPQPGNSVSSVTQEEIVRFRITFEARKLRGAGGLYSLMQSVHSSLIGLKLTNAATRLTYVKYGLLEFEQNSWQPYFEYECKAVHVQAFNDNDFDVPFGDASPQVFTNEYELKDYQ